MDTEGLNITEEAKLVVSAINKGKNFLLSGVAGSGKTYSLVEVINTILQNETESNIACITYTNAAAREINGRISDERLVVSTIHDFLWDNIKTYQHNMKEVLLQLIQSEEECYRSFNFPDGVNAEITLFDDLENGIQYKEFRRLAKGIISHDELLVLAHKMYELYPKLCNITKDKYQYILVDEYQDTSEVVVKILLECFEKSTRKTIIGFFGDSMQAIYAGGVGDISYYLSKNGGLVEEVSKVQNRRNPSKVIQLANILRTDSLVQEPSRDSGAPNMLDGIVKEGTAIFMYSSDPDVDKVRSYLNWDLTKTKELNLTHNLISQKGGFADLYEIYNGDQILKYVNRVNKVFKESNINDDYSEKTFGEVVELLKVGKTGSELNKLLPTNGMNNYIAGHDVEYRFALNCNYHEIASIYVDSAQLIDDMKDNPDDLSKPNSKRDNLIKHLNKIQDTIRLYRDGLIYDFLKVIDYKITSIADKIQLKSVIDSLIQTGEKSIGEIIDEANSTGICVIDDKLDEFITKKGYIYERVKKVPFRQFQNLYDYLEGNTPFSTQHKTKGTEIDNVLVILDNGNWNQYNFESLFTGEGSESVINRTKKLFYVCCTRAKENLTVFYNSPPETVLSKAREWFGEENMVSLDAL